MTLLATEQEKVGAVKLVLLNLQVQSTAMVDLREVCAQLEAALGETAGEEE